MNATRNHYCDYCDRKTEQFRQSVIDFNSVTGDNFIWHCRRCNKSVRELAQKELNDIFRRKNLDNLIGHIAQYFKIEISDIRSNNKSYSVVQAKHLFSFIALRMKYGSTSEIGRYLDRPHNAVQRGKKIIDSKLHRVEVQRHVNAITNIIERTDKVLLFRTVLQNTPPEKLPRLIDYINEFQKTQVT